MMISGGFHIKSRRGLCGFHNDIFTCGHQIHTPALFEVRTCSFRNSRFPEYCKKKKANMSAITFKQITSDDFLSYNGNTTFFADKAPKGHVQSKVFAHGGDGGHAVELTIAWYET